MRKLLTVSAALVAVAFLAGPALAGKEITTTGSGITIDDKAGAFTPEGIKKAEDAFNAVTFKSPTHLHIVTYKTVPENKKSEYEAAKGSKDTKARFFKTWATDLAEKRGSRGVFVLISMEGAHIHAIDDRQTDSRRGFDDADLKRLEEKLGDGFVKGNKVKENEAEAKKARDEGLLNGVNFVVAELKNTSAPEAADNKAAAKRAAGGGLSVLQWVLIIGGGLLVMWIVIGLIRALTGGGGGGGGGGYGGGGGGGGFFSSLMGGMLGAAAGMYLYNSMFGSGMSSASAGDSYGGDAGGGGYDNGAGDYAGGGDGGGTDFDTGGGDAGGGGDWGGGGDVGGGDFGGGGGDW